MRIHSHVLRTNSVILVHVLLALTWALAACAPASPAPAVPVPPASPTSPASSPSSQSSAPPTAVPVRSTPVPQITPTVVSRVTPTPAASAQYGGTLTLTNYESPSHFDMLQGVRTDVSIPFRNVYSALLRRDPIETEKIIPELAESWTVSQDGLTYTFVIRKGALWHDGQPVTTRDVEFSLTRMKFPPKGVSSPRGQSLLEGVVSIKALDDSRVELKLDQPSSSFLGRIATDWVVIVPKHTTEKQGDLKQVVNGSGPFKFVRYTSGVSVELTKNKDYFASGRPFVDNVVLYILPDAGTSFAALRTGRVLMSTLGSRAATDAQIRITQNELADKITVERYQSFSRYLVRPNLQVKPWDDARVREALDLATNRQEFVKLTLLGIPGGYFHPNTKWGLPVNDLTTRPGWRQPKDQDIAAAKKLLTDAGYNKEANIQLLCRRGADCEIYATTLKSQLEPVGFRTTVTPMEGPVLEDRMAKGEFSLVLHALGVGLDDPDSIIFEQHVSDAPRNYGKYKDAEIDAWAKEQSKTLDESKRRDLVRKIDNRLTEAHVSPSLLWLDYVRLYWKSVRGIRHGPGIYTDENLEYVWLAK